MTTALTTDQPTACIVLTSRMLAQLFLVLTINTPS